MSETHLEIELKLELAGGAPLPDLTGLHDVLGPDVTFPPPSREDLDAVYFDTSDLRLFHAGWTLRRRTGGRDAGWHLKLPQARPARLEVRQPLGRSTRVVPLALRRFAWIHSRGAALVPIVKLTTTRTVHQLCAADGTVLAELADDEVRASRLERLPGRRGSSEPTSWREVEVELVAGDRRLLDTVDHWLRAHGATRSASASKLARALGLEATGLDTVCPAHGMSEQATAAEVVVPYLRQQVCQIRRGDPLVRLATPDSVHQMRVATRRVRSALDTFQPLFRPDVTRDLQAELKWLADALGRPRDAEVQLAALRAGLDIESGRKLMARTVGRAVERTAVDQQRAALRDLTGALDSDRYRQLISRLDRLVQDPPMTSRAERPAAKVLPKLVMRSYEEVARAMAGAARLPDGSERDEALHAGRKSAKRARYAAEAVSPAFGKPARRFALAMAELGEELGEYHDGVVTMTRLRERALRQDSTAAAFTYGRLHAAAEARQVVIDARIGSAWLRAARPSLRKWLRSG